MKRLLFLLLPLLLSSPALHARGVDRGVLDDSPQDNRQFTPPPPWREEQTTLPRYPVQGEMLPLAVDTANRSFSFFIDPKSISVGSDQVVRYAIAIESKSGGRNIFYEGMRCSTREYKLYATGGGDKRWHPLGNPQWRPIPSGGVTRYRADLFRFYLCVRGRPMGNVAAIIDNIKFPKNIDRDSLY